MKRNLLGHAFRPPRMPGIWMAIALAALLLAVLYAPVSATVMWTEDFENAAASSNWTVTNGTWAVEATPANPKGLSFKIPSTPATLAFRSINPSGSQYVKLTFEFYLTSTAYQRIWCGTSTGTGGMWYSSLARFGDNNVGGQLHFQYWTTALQTVNAVTTGLTTGWHTAAVVINPSAQKVGWSYEGGAFHYYTNPNATMPNQVFVGYSYTANQVAYYDNIKAEKFATPGKVASPSPANDGVDVPATGTVLSWTAGASATKYDVYFGTSSNPPKVSTGQAGLTYDPGTLAPDTKYYWRVDSCNDDIWVTQGDTWTFTTVGSNVALLLVPTPTEGGTCTGQGSYPAGTQVPISATANPGYVFMCWANDSAGTDVVSTLRSTNYTMPGTAKTLYAVFEARPTLDYIIESRDPGQHRDWYSDNFGYRR